MKKIIFFIFTLLLIASLSLHSSAESFSWYCKREKDHKTPQSPPEFSFITDYDAFSHDTSHTDCNESEKVIYLTFDAGYENGNVEKTLDILKEKEVKAAFFILGNLVERNTELVKRMIDEGHLICNHTYSHKDMSKLGEGEFCAELKKLEDCCVEKIGTKPSKYYRPPEGRFSAENLAWAKNSGYMTVFWSFAYADWDNSKQPDPEKAKQKIFDNLHNGEIMLLHPTSKVNAMILSDIIDHARAEGFRFASLDELK